MQFNAIIGQSHAQQILQQLAQRGRMPHALLLLGQTGAGNLSLALALAQLLQCHRLGDNPSGDSCGECPACRKSMAYSHPDIHFSYPTVGPNAISTDFLKEWRLALQQTKGYLNAYNWLSRIGDENKQGNITRAECQAIVKKLSLKIFEGRFKILILWMPEYLEKEGNRLLKLIEEPPEQTVFLLVAESADAILPTILSRCQIVRIDPLSDEEIAKGLQQFRELDENRARQLAFLAGGNFFTALELADQPENDDATMLLDWLRLCWKGHGVELVKWTETFAKLGRENQKQFLLYGLHFLREVMVLSAAGQAQLRLGTEELKTTQNFAKVLNFHKITNIASLMNDNIYFLERNANPKILFLDTAIQLNKIFKSP